MPSDRLWTAGATHGVDASREDPVAAIRATLQLDVRPLVTGERVIRGCSYGGARTREDLPRLVSLYLAGRLKIDELITYRYVGRHARGRMVRRRPRPHHVQLHRERPE
jgi:hypothetical protein